MFGVRACLLILAAHLVALGAAVIIVSPSNKTTWVTSERLRIEWTSSPDDPVNVTVALINQGRTPTFDTTLAESLRTSSNEFTADVFDVPSGTGYHVQLIRRTNSSDQILARSEEFSAAQSPAAPSPSPSPAPATSSPVAIIAAVVCVVVALIVIVIGFYFCWFRKRRRQIRAQYPKERPRSNTSAGLGRASPTNSIPETEIKTNLEPRFSSDDIEKVPTKTEEYDLERQSTPPAPEPSPISPNPPPIPPPPPIPETAEMPIFITPRSSRSFFNSLRRPRTPSERPRTPAELDSGSRSVRSIRPASLNEAEIHKATSEPPSPGRRSKRQSLHQVLHSRKSGGSDECCKMPPQLADHPALRRAQTEVQDDKNSTCLPRRSRSKRLSLQGFLHLRRYAELEGSSVDVPPLPTAAVDDKESPTRRTKRLSLHRLISSKRLAELEAHTDALPEYSRTDQNANMKRDSLPPPLPPKDKAAKESLEYKAHYSPSPSNRRTMTPVELDASETQRRFSPAKSRNRSKRRTKLPSAGSTRSEDSKSGEWADEDSDDGYEDINIHMAKSPNKMEATDAQAPNLEADDFLDLASTDSDDDGGESENDRQATTLPPRLPTAEEGNMDPFLTAEIISAAVEASSHQPRSMKPIHIANARLRAKANEVHPTIHEMDATETVVKRRSKRSSHNVGSTKGDSGRRRPDFLTFKKQMTEAERRAKMIAKRKSRRRMPKSF